MKFDIKSTRTQTLIFFGLIGFVLIWVFRRYLFFQDLFIFTDIGSDTMTLFYPSMLDNIRYWRSEGIPFWSFTRGLGQGIYGRSILNPFNWIQIALGTDILAYSIGWLQIAKIFLISIFSYYYFRLMKLSKWAIYLGVILSTFLGYIIIGACWYGHLSTIMYMFLFLLAFELIIMKGKWWLLPIPVFFYFSPKLYFFLEFSIIYIVLRLALLNLLNWKTIFKAIPQFLGPGMMGVMLSAPFLGSIFYSFLYSPRVGGSVSYTTDLMSSSPFRLESMNHYGTAVYRFFSNDLLGTGSDFQGWNNYLEAPIFYAGIISLLLVPQLFRFLNRKQLIVCSSILLLWVIIVIFPFFRNAFYLFVGNYYKSALSFFIPFTLLFLGVLAFHKIIQSKKVNLYLLGLSFVVLMFILFIPFEVLREKIDTEVRWLVVLFLVIHTLLLSFYNFVQNKSIVLYLILLAALIEGGVMANIGINDREVISTKEFENRTYHNDYTLEAIEYIHANDKPFYRIEKTYGSVLSGYNDNQSQNFFGTRSYRSHNHNNYIRFLESMGIIKPNDEVYTRWVIGLQKIPQLHPLFSLKYMVSNQEKKSEIDFSMYDDLGEMNGLNIYKNKYYLPLGIPISNVISTSEFSSISGYYRKIELLYNAVIIDDVEISKYSGLNKYNTSKLRGALNFKSYHDKLSSKAMKMESFTQSRIKGSIQLDEPSMILFSFPFDKGWKAKLNGKDVDLVEIDNGLTGLYAEAGNFQIDLKYRPPFFVLGWIVFFLSIGFYIYLLRRSKYREFIPLGDDATPTLIGLTTNPKIQRKVTKSSKKITPVRSAKKGKYRNKKR